MSGRYVAELRALFRATSLCDHYDELQHYRLLAETGGLSEDMAKKLPEYDVVIPF